MGLAGGIVRRVFSKGPCSSAGTGSRGGHSVVEKGSAAADDHHRRRWSSLRLYLCGEEMNAAAEEDDDGDTVSVKSFETTCCVMPPPEEEANVVPVDNDSHGENQSIRVPAGEQSRHGHVVAVPAREEDEGAATLIQSAFRAFMARRQLQELKMADGGAQCQDGQEPTTTRSPTWATASVATSVLVQVGEPLSNLRLLSEDSASVQQRRRRSCSQSQQRSRPPPPPPAASFRAKEEWDDSTVSSNVSRMRIQSRIDATTRRERALAYAFSQQLRSCGGGGSKKRSSARVEQGEEMNNVGWSWLDRWMATRQAPEPATAADDCMSRNADTAAEVHRRVVVVRARRRNSSGNDLAGEEKESCGSNDVSVVSFDGSSGSLGGGGARSGLGCHRPPAGSSSKNRLKGGGRSLPRRKQVAASDQTTRSHKVSKKGHQRVEQEPHKDKDRRLDAGGFDDAFAYQPPTDY